VLASIAAGQTQSQCLFSISTGIDPRSLTFQNKCSHCQTIMYSGPENSPLNHKKGYCADGVKQSSKAAGKDLPPWPQPRGIFSDGQTFHPHVFLSTVQHVYEHVFMQGPGETDLLETEAFSKLLNSCTKVYESDDMVLSSLTQPLPMTK
jgi:hypothetical protein